MEEHNYEYNYKEGVSRNSVIINEPTVPAIMHGVQDALLRDIDNKIISIYPSRKLSNELKKHVVKDDGKPFVAFGLKFMPYIANMKRDKPEILEGKWQDGKLAEYYNKDLSGLETMCPKVCVEPNQTYNDLFRNMISAYKWERCDTIMELFNKLDNHA